MPNEIDSPETPESPLKTPVEELRRRCEAISRLQGGHTYYGEEIGIFREYAEENGLILPIPPSELSRTPDDEGNEHQVWFQPETNCYLKATWPDFFGKLVVYPPSDSPNASPIGYLERWHFHNELFGDSAQFLGGWLSNQGLRLIIRQPAIAGVPATESQIRTFFVETNCQSCCRSSAVSGPIQNLK